MRGIIAVWIVMLMLIGGMIGVVNLSTDAEADNGDAEIKSASQAKSGLITHDPIYIGGNSDFTSANGVSNPSAEGTEIDPYIIENYDINASSAHGIYIENTNVCFIIRNCVIHDGKNNNCYGIYFDSMQNGKINNVTSYNNRVGICLDSSSNNNQVSNCTVYNNTYSGIYLGYWSYNNEISNCNIYNNSHYSGICIDYSSNNTITNNTFTNDGIFIWRSLYTYPQTIDNNTVNGKPLYYFLNKEGIILDGIDVGQLILVNCTNFTIKNLDISYTNPGIELLYSSNNNITDCTVYNNSDMGIYLILSSNNNTISNCTVYNNNYDGIRLYGYSNNNTITNCSVYNNYNSGIYLYSSSNDNIVGNTFTNDGIGITGDLDYCAHTIKNNTINGKPLHYFLNEDKITLDNIEAGQLILVNCTNFTIKNLDISYTDVGIRLLYSSNNTITNCAIYNNDNGIFLWDSSNNNTISDCTVYNNSDMGIYLSFSSGNNLTDCDVYNNSDNGIVLYLSSDTEVHYCNIYDNTGYGVYNSNTGSEYVVNATYNWWGSADGPYHPDTNPNGTGENVTDKVLYDPWLTEPWTGENQPPVADFTYPPALTVSTFGRIINFMDLSYDPDGNITAWFWGFGDNNTSTEQNPTHQYLAAGNYTVNLTVTDDDDAINTTSKEITITVLDIGIITNISLTITNISLSNFTFVNLSWLNISYAVNITNLSVINISCINITNLINISNMSFANVFEVTLTNLTYMSSSSFINVSYVNITQSMSVNNLMFNNVGYAYLQDITSMNFVITAILDIITIAYENLQMVIPEEALTLSMPFNLSTTSVPLPLGYDVVGDIYRIECGVSIGAPISITLSYAGIVLPPGITEEDLAVYKKVGDNWIKVDSIIDKLNSTVSAQVTSFSDYAILYKQPSTEDGEESKPSAKPFDISWLYIIITTVVVGILAIAGMGIKCGKKKLPPEKPTG